MSDRIYYMPGATAVGVKCKDGVILAAEKRLSLGYYLLSKKARKTFKVTDSIGMVCAGMVADMQMLSKMVSIYANLYKLEKEKNISTKAAAKVISNLLFNLRLTPLLTETIIGGVDKDGPHIYILDPLGALIEDKYAATGSGAPIAIGIIESEYKDTLTVKECEKLVEKAIRAALSRDIGSGDGIDMMIITKDGIQEKFIPFTS
ncbi:proteasome endopeptidase complex, archaeal, beta subunit [archaeon]|nr:MAG: proteasome endopeptidase complex, archaeal, beta subunit [archaeon]RLG65321.1 MAG: proteasome endopeptidase complex, archaeal, beta subunit [archaeon]RLG66837.1 MAG: proteasome endopeptidase complex, archaeal, beta subunit [archaeon]